MKKIKRQWEMPAWLDRVIIRERVWRWRLAERLQHWTLRVAPGRLRLYFMFFFMGMGMLYSYLLVRGLDGQPTITWEQQLKRLPPAQAALIRDSGYDKALEIEKAKIHSLMDSVNSDPDWKRRFDSLLKARPGFADTLRELNKFFK